MAIADGHWKCDERSPKNREINHVGEGSGEVWGSLQHPLSVGVQMPPFVALKGTAPFSVPGEEFFGFRGWLPSTKKKEGTFTAGWDLPCPSPTSIVGAGCGWCEDAQVAFSIGEGVGGAPQCAALPVDLAKKGGGCLRPAVGLPLSCCRVAASGTVNGPITEGRAHPYPRTQRPSPKYLGSSGWPY